MDWNSGMEYTMEQLVYAMTANSCHWHCSIYFELSIMSLGILSYCRGCISRSSVLWHASLSDDVTVRKLGVLKSGFLDPSSAI